MSITFAFKAQEVTVSQVRLYLPIGTGISIPTRVELLASATSPDIGFFSIGVYSISPGTECHTLSFSPVPLRYLLLRITDSSDGNFFSVNEIEIWGMPGREKSDYRFNFTPVSAEIMLQKLRPELKFDLRIAPIEKTMFADARDGQFDVFSFAEAALIAGNGLTKTRRQLYLQKIMNLWARIQQQLPATTSAYARGQNIFAYLHRHVFKKYVRNATNLCQILDRGEFNCVSSMVLYNIFGKLAGIDVRGVEVPDHTFAILYDGVKHWDIETTNPVGFDSGRSQQAIQVLQQQTGFIYIAQQKGAQRRELSALAQVAIIYYNRGVELANRKHFEQSSLNYFKALFLDRSCASAVKNLLANFANYGIEISKQGQFDNAVRYIEIARSLAPTHRQLRNDLVSVYHNWAVILTRKGNYYHALEILRLAHNKFPEERMFLSDIAYVYFYHAQKLQQAGDLSSAVMILDQGIEEMGQPRIRSYLQKARSHIFATAALARIKVRDWAGAIAIYEKGLRLNAQDADLRIRRNAAYLEWAEEVASSYGVTAALKIYRQALAKDPGDRRFAASLKLLYLERAYRKTKKKEYAKAIELLTALLQLYPREKRALNNIIYVYQQWNQQLLGLGKVSSAHTLYRNLTRRFPEMRELHLSFLSQFGRQGIAYIEQEAFVKAAEINCFILLEFPQESKAENNLLYCLQQRRQSLLAGGDIVGAIKMHEELLARFPQLKILKTALVQFGLRQSLLLAEAGKLADAQSILGRLKRKFPAHTRVSKIHVYILARCGEYYVKQKRWPQALAVYRQGWALYPQEKLFENNLRYCQKQITQASSN